MKIQSAKDKGRRFENKVAQDIKEGGLGFATREIGSGSGLMKGDIASNLDWIIEAKNQKKLDWWSSIRQAKRQAQEGNYYKEKWMLVVRDPTTPENNSDIIAVVDWYQLLKLLKTSKQPRMKKMDREMKWKVEHLIDAAKSLLKEFKE